MLRPQPFRSSAPAGLPTVQTSFQIDTLQIMGRDIAAVAMNGGPISEFPNFSKLPHELRAQIWESVWEPRYVKVERRIGSHKSDSDCSGSEAKVQARRRRRDRILHSHAAMLEEWDGSPYVQAIGRDLTVTENKLSHNATKLAKRRGSIQQEDLQRVHTITTAAASPPETLFVNKESRLITLRRYTLAFALPGGESRVYFNFGLDTLVLSRHAQLAHAFTKGDLGRLQRISVPEVKVDDSGDYEAVGASTDWLYQQQGAEGILVGDLMNGATPEQQALAVFASSRAVLDAICPKIEQIVFSPITTCLKVCPSTGHKDCARHFSKNGFPNPLYKVDQHDESWEAGRTTIADCRSHMIEPKMKRDFGLTQKRYSAQEGMGEGVLFFQDCKTGSDEVVVSMLGVQHEGLPDLGGPAYHTKLRVYEWGRRVRQAECARINLDWLLDISGTVRKKQTLDYEL